MEVGNGFVAFDTAYKGLNLSQKKAVDTIEGPVMVIAGPGTGKTQILTLRIANILRKTDTAPQNILALTFTESGARAMRERLVSYIGSAAYQVPIHTFHGFSESLIRQYGDQYPRIIGSRPATDLEKIGCIERILEDTQIKHLRPLGDPSYYIVPILRMITTLKQEYITPDLLAEKITEEEKVLSGMQRLHEKGAHKGKVRSEYQKKEKSILKNKELLLIYREYEALLRTLRVYDFDDMLVETVRALESNEDMLRDLEETYQYILADEHQDVNGTQNRILELLTSYHESPNLFVVGDEKQAIYRFQGASLENFLYFENKYAHAEAITLTENYRSTQLILDAAHSLIKVEEGPLKDLRVPLTGKSGGKKIVKNVSTHEAIEDDHIARTIVELQKTGVPLSEIAVIVRTNKEVEQLSTVLKKAGLPVTQSADADILTHRVTQNILSLIDAISRPEDERALFEVLMGSYWEISREDLVRVVGARSYERSLASILTDEVYLQELNVKDIEHIMHIGDVFQSARKREITHAPQQILEYVLEESGFLKAATTTDPFEGVRVIRRIYDEIEEEVRRDSSVTLRNIGDIFRAKKSHRLSIHAPYIVTHTESVTVETAHKSKGLEYGHVFLPHLVDSVWGGGRKVEHFKIALTRHLDTELFDTFDDEKRLLYVAMTRAKVALHISYSETNTEGRVLVPSRLLESIAKECIEVRHTDPGSFDPVASIRTPLVFPLLDVETIRTLFAKRGLSATSLNNYLSDPWEYFFRNLLRMPETQSETLLFGTAMHGVLQHATTEFSKMRVMPDATKVKSLLDRELRKLPITKETFVRLHEKGFAPLLSYLSHIKPSMPPSTKEEFRLRVSFETGVKELPEISLTGMLDRLDFDEEGRLVRIIDYKTGKPKTRGYIEGTTKDSNGEYKRQLVFYALLLSLYGDERYNGRECILSFVEPDNKGNIHEERYVITDDEIESLKSDIRRICAEIISGACMYAPLTDEKSIYASYVPLFRTTPQEPRVG